MGVIEKAVDAMKDLISGGEKIRFESTLEKLGRIIARQYHIDVQFEGNQATTNGKTIILPMVNKLTETLKQDMNGFLDSAVGHCRYTNFDELKKPTKRFERELLSICEDSRAEKEMVEEYPGCSLNLDPMNERLDEKVKAKWGTYPAPIRIMFGIRKMMDGKSPIVDSDTERYLEAVADEAAELGKAKSTRELREGISRITKIVEEEREKELAEDDDEGEEGEEGEGGSGRPSDQLNWDDKKKKSKGGDSGEPGEPDEGDSSKGGKEPPKTEKNKEQKGKGDKEKGDGKGPKEEKGDKSADDKKFDDMMKEQAENKGPSEFDKHDTSAQDMVNEQLENNIKKSEPADRDTRGGSPYMNDFDYRPSIPATTRFDKIIDETNAGDPSAYAKAKLAVQKHVGGIQRNLERVLKVRENARYRLEQERGHINAAALGKLASDQNYRLPFKEFHRTDTTNVAVEILIDMSGSMHRGKILVATQAAIAMGEALLNLGIAFEVTGFHSEGDSGLQNYVTQMSRNGQDTSRFNRTQERIDFHVFKSFTNSRMYGLTQIQAYGNNTDGESVRMAAKRLAVQKQKRKILIVMSDGLPHDAGNWARLNADLQKAVGDIKAAGIECVGIGIQSDAVKRFYPEYVVINNIEDLPKAAMTKLSNILLRGFEKAL